MKYGLYKPKTPLLQSIFAMLEDHERLSRDIGIGLDFRTVFSLPGSDTFEGLRTNWAQMVVEYFSAEAEESDIVSILEDFYVWFDAMANINGVHTPEQKLIATRFYNNAPYSLTGIGRNWPYLISMSALQDILRIKEISNDL